MKRRTLVRDLVALPAGVAALAHAQQPMIAPKPTPAALEQIPVIESTVPDGAAEPLRTFFNTERWQTLQHLCDLIVPASDGVPGALEAKAPEFLDFLLGQSGTKRQHLYNSGLDSLQAKAKDQFGVSFAATSREQSSQLLAPLNDPWTATGDTFSEFLRSCKQDAIQATENSREWIRVVSKRIRSAGGLGMYWFPID